VLLFGELRGNVHGSSMARWQACGQLPISGNWTFSLALTVEALWADIARNYCVQRGGGSLWGQISGWMKRRPPTTVGVKDPFSDANSRWWATQYRRVTVRRTDRRTDTLWRLITALAYRCADKNGSRDHDHAH